MRKKQTKAKGSLWVVYYLYLLVVWGVFRLLFKLPVLLDELWFKPVLWLLPLYFFWYREGRVVKLFGGEWKRALLWGVGVGGFYLLVIKGLKLARAGMGGVEGLELTSWDLVGVGVVTAVTEEIVFSGYLFSKVMGIVKNVWTGMVINGVMFGLIHVPIGLFVYQYSGGEMTGFLLMVGLLAAANGYLMWRTKNVIAPIMAHWLWSLAVLWGR